MVKYNESTIARFQIAMVFKFCVSPTSKRWVMKRVHLMPRRLYIHLTFAYVIGPSRPWTGSTFLTNENVSSAMVMGPQTCVCEVVLK